MRLSIVIPAYNEEDRLPLTLDSIEKFFRSKASGTIKLHEVIVADDGSEDRTSTVADLYADRLPIRALRLPHNRGKGAASRMGMLAATGEYVLLYDADGATPIEEILKFQKALEKTKVDIVIGSRLGSQRSPVHMRWHRRLIGRIYHALCAPLVWGLDDTACGCKLFRRDVAQKLFKLQKIDRFAFDVEVLSIAILLKYRIADVLVRWHAVPGSKVSIMRDSVQMFLSVCWLYFQRVGLLLRRTK